jgi:hypothetical protein
MCLDYAMPIKPTKDLYMLKEFNLTDQGSLVGKIRKTLEYMPDTTYSVKHDVDLKCMKGIESYKSGFHAYSKSLMHGNIFRDFPRIVVDAMLYGVHTVGTQNGFEVFVGDRLHIESIIHIPNSLRLYSFDNKLDEWVGMRNITRKKAIDILEKHKWKIDLDLGFDW